MHALGGGRIGLLQPSEGSVRVAGHDVVADPRAAHLRTGYVPDEAVLYEKLTGHEFLRFIADLFGMPRVLSDRRIEEAVDTFELHGFIDDLAEGYSLGMRKKLLLEHQRKSASRLAS